MAEAKISPTVAVATKTDDKANWPLVKKPHAPFYFGGFAACAANFFTHPLDLLKAIYTEQGALGFYNGISAAVLRQMTSICRIPDGSLPFYRMAFAGVVAGAVGGVAGTPADIVLVEQRRNYKNAFDGLFRIAREDGVSGLFKGAVPNYDAFKDLLLNSGYFKEGLPLHFSASFLAGFVATTITSPFDVVKTRIMNAAMVLIAKEEGPMALYKGWTPSFVRMAPQTILTFIFLEQFKSIYWDRTAKANKVRYE
ncbi:mitochondrial carrier [Linderina pennispora]|uniref:Mitochondrial carrier n=1 Tax=Linderina pennispora TaxID=61395 RepID=A0A1Y1VXM0_9FUNG|nr:mitochondrial carrier [Linderina pennispora]ORX66007.1 mitochondrial carrier [Linderina pennispora]